MDANSAGLTRISIMDSLLVEVVSVTSGKAGGLIGEPLKAVVLLPLATQSGCLQWDLPVIQTVTAGHDCAWLLMAILHSEPLHKPDPQGGFFYRRDAEHPRRCAERGAFVAVIGRPNPGKRKPGGVPMSSCCTKVPSSIHGRSPAACLGSAGQ